MNFVLAIALLVATAITGFSQALAVDYARDVKPVLRERCYSCHGVLKQEAGLRLDTGSLARKGGESGAAIVAGDPHVSHLMARITSGDDSMRMPPEGKPLTAEQVGILTRWIESGAISPNDEEPEHDPRSHWAFQKLVRPAVPFSTTSSASPPTNPIDAFINQQRTAKAIVGMPPTDKATLLRRVYLDLIGLPPSAEELYHFSMNESENAYDEVVERLLASPQHGERWGRHWMDIWRYSDWYGRRSVPDVMNSYPMVWRWRDWIVRSINEDKPYDQMIVEMLAADELMPADDNNIVATGYLVRSWFKWNYETWKKDLVEHTGKAFLGLTLNCCQCHDHKFDPFTQEEYFRFRAFFEPLELRHDRVPSEADPGPFAKYEYAKSYGPIKSGMVRVFDEYLSAETFMFSKGDSRLRIEGKPPVTPAVPASLGESPVLPSQIALPLTAAYPGMKAFIKDEERTTRRDAVFAAERELEKVRAMPSVARLQEAQTAIRLPSLRLAAAQARLLAAELEMNCIDKRFEADEARFASGVLSEDKNTEPQIKNQIQLACQSERNAAVAKAKADLVSNDESIASVELKIAEASKRSDKKELELANKALQTAQKNRLSALKSFEEANSNLSKELGEYTPLSPKYPQISSGRRIALAQWIASSENPLTARVAVNHIWLRHFGRALVETTHDFGRNGSPPTHPQLLDYLACDLIDSGWSMKHLHRLIVTSQAYRMTSMLPSSSSDKAIGGKIANGIEAANAIDPDNKTVWRFPESRMQAEVVRDSLLQVAGELDLTMGGHEIDHKLGMTSHRRSLYFAHHGEEKMEFLELFDAANACDCYKRTSSVQPQQALALTNSELTKTLSRQLAKSLWEYSHGADNTSDQFVNIAFRQVLNREPREREFAASLLFLDQQSQRLTHSDPNKQSVLGMEKARVNFIHALMNHNDFVTVR